MTENPHLEQEGFGEAGLGDAQASEPPSDPDMIRDDAEAAAAEIERDESHNPGEGPLKDIKGG